MVATLLTGAVWVCWHIPLWFIEGNSHQSMAFFPFAVLGLALSFWLTAIHRVTGGIVFCMILHGWTNTLMGLLDRAENLTYYLALSFLTAVSIVICLQPLSKKQQ